MTALGLWPECRRPKSELSGGDQEGLSIQGPDHPGEKEGEELM